VDLLFRQLEVPSTAVQPYNATAELFWPAATVLLLREEQAATLTEVAGHPSTLARHQIALASTCGLACKLPDQLLLAFRL